MNTDNTWQIYVYILNLNIFDLSFLTKINLYVFAVFLEYRYIQNIWSHFPSRLDFLPAATPKLFELQTADTYTYKDIDSFMHTCIHIHSTYIHKYIHTNLHTYIHTNLHTYIYTYIHTYIHTYIRTYIHTYIHTYIQLDAFGSSSKLMRGRVQRMLACYYARFCCGKVLQKWGAEGWFMESFGRKFWQLNRRPTILRSKPWPSVRFFSGTWCCRLFLHMSWTCMVPVASQGWPPAGSHRFVEQVVFKYALCWAMTM